MKFLRLLLVLVVSFGAAIGCAQQQNEATKLAELAVPGRLDTTSLGVYGFIIQGDAVKDQLGYSVSAAGDINGDGYADLIVGALKGDDGGEDAGEAYVIWGQANKQYGNLGNDGRRVVDTTNLGDAGFIIKGDAGGDAAGDFLGWSVSAAGDVNGDGYADLIVGASHGDDGGQWAGEAYVIWGQADKAYGTLGSDGRRVVDTSSLGDAGFIIQGDERGDFLGISVSAAGDVNGDGFADLIVGAPYSGDGGMLAGAAYLIWGQADKAYGTLGNDGRRVLDTTNLGDAGFIIQGDARGDRLGQSVSAAGDVNGDGYADIIVGTLYEDERDTGAGEAYVIWGQASKAYGALNSDGRRVVDTTTLGDAGFIIQNDAGGDAGGDAFGWSASAAGDVDGDGYADLIIGSHNSAGGGNRAGEAYVLWGQASKAYGTLDSDGRRVVDTTTLGNAGFIIQGDARGDTLGVSVSAGGDANADGYADLIVGALYGDDGGSNAGEAYVIWGQASKAYGTLGSDGRRVVDTSSLGDAGLIIQGDAIDDRFGVSVAAAGDVDGDGYADLIVGALLGDDGGEDAGEAYVIWGGGHLSGDRLGYDPDLANQPKRAFAANVETTDYAFDFSDLFINATGKVVLSYRDTESVSGDDNSNGATAGAATWNASREVLSIDLSAIGEDFEIFITATDNDNGDSALWRMAVAEKFPTVAAPIADALVGDNFSAPSDGADIAIDLMPVFGGGDGTLSYATSLGSISDGELTIPLSTLSKGDNTITVTATDADGDAVNHDFVLTKSSLAVTGLIDTTSLGTRGFIIQGDEKDDRLGRSVSAAGDINGDGYADLIIGASGGDDAGENAGEAYVIWGQGDKAYGILGNDGRRVVDTTSLGDAGFIIQGDTVRDYFGASVSAAGDVNDDGYADLIIGAPHGHDGGQAAGEAYVIWGQASKAYGTLGSDGRRVFDTTRLGDDGFIIQGDEEQDRLGRSVSAAGDVNGDGYADLIVGADESRGGGRHAGVAYVIWGQASKAYGDSDSNGRRVVDTSNLGDAGFIIQGDARGDRLGQSVSAAGDVNGDGYDDLIVGASGGGGVDRNAGEAYVIWGQASKVYGTLDSYGRRVLDTTNLGDAGFIIEGDAESDLLGRSVSAAGDINGDGYADLIVGANWGDDGGEDAGEAYVIWGQASKAYGTLRRDGQRVFYTTRLGDDAGFIIQGDEKDDRFGWSVAAAGDANGDGYADLIVGAQLFDDRRSRGGEAYVIWGQPGKTYGTMGRDGSRVVDTSNLGDAGFIIQGNEWHEYLGTSVSAAGDVNGDGYSDLIVGAENRDNWGEDAGEAYVIWGGAHLSGYRLGYDPDSANQPKRAFDANVETTDYAFDFSDLFANANGTVVLSYSDTESFSGDDAKTGAATWNAVTEALSIDHSAIGENFDIFITATDDDGNSALWRTTVAGKSPTVVEAIPDTIAQALVGSNFSSPSSDGADIAVDLMAVFGGGNGTLSYAASLGSISDGELTIAFSALSEGENTISVTATDADGDAVNDVFVITKSSLAVSGRIDTTSLGVHGFVIQGDARGDFLGGSVSTAGDVNGDGYVDLIVGAHRGGDGGSKAGEAYVIWGQADKQYGTLGSDGRHIVDLSSLGDAGFIIQGDAKGDWFGSSVSTAGDVNGDGYADLIVGAPFSDGGDDGGERAGEAYVIWGQASKAYGTLGSDGRRVLDTTNLGDAGFIIQNNAGGDAEQDWLGYSVSTAGDVNGDGYAELIVGAPRGDEEGKGAEEVYVIWGQARKAYGNLGSDGRRVVDITKLGDAGFIIQGNQANNDFGVSVSAAGDVNGDGYADLIVGSTGSDLGGVDAGEAFVIWGQADKAYGTLGSDGRRVVSTDNFGDAGFVIQGDRHDDFLGRSVSAAGDVDGDGYADLIVGAFGGNDGGQWSGEAYLIWGQADKAYGTLDRYSRRVVDTTKLGNAGYIIQGNRSRDTLGTSVSAAGDVNGDGYADLIVGAYRGDDGGEDAGEAYVIWGQAKKTSGTLGRYGRRVVDTNSLGDAGFIIQGDAVKDQLGYSVSAAGDVNGDGYADLIVGARHGDDGTDNAGEAYVIWGGAHLSGYRLGYDPDSANQPKRAFDANVETTDYAFDFSDLFINANGTVVLSYSDTESVSGNDTQVGAATWDASTEVLSIDLSAITEDFDIIITATDSNGNSALWHIAVLPTGRLAHW